MPHWGYSITELDPERTAVASGRDLRISTKDAVEVCNAIRGMMLEDAMKLLEEVIALKTPIPFRRHKKKVAHHAGLADRWGIPSGRYPVKAAKEILKVLKNARANAESKGLNVERLRVIHAAAQQGMRIRKYIPRAFGRATPYFHPLTHIEIAVREE
ncbi:MAG: 50S ribosomal protein L22 [Candidatus Methanomethylicota archaeon]|uniref:Large ribosomal subunit protein uL22 n=1 Tax=Thermoproteota archaeon TaxID=2056631 RepID=A0A497EZN1_9CREN|nr:MAG: 50S ribosomal protein L22 [Candidatus Verstraetearchaeota archaeon]